MTEMGLPFMYFMSLDKIALYLIKVFSKCLRAKIAFSFGEEERKEMKKSFVQSASISIHLPAGLIWVQFSSKIRHCLEINKKSLTMMIIHLLGQFSSKV